MITHNIICPEWRSSTLALTLGSIPATVLALKCKPLAHKQACVRALSATCAYAVHGVHAYYVEPRLRIGRLLCESICKIAKNILKHQES